ncbi:MAG: hypothetical protein KAZ98_04370 [Prevotella sp.]|nr:hypothetical protein [Prevotella sp.]
MVRAILLLVALVWSVSSTAQHFDLDKDLAQLDSVVEHYDLYIADKEKEIAEYKESSGLLVAASDQYHYARQLYNLYLKLDADSALKYAQRSLAIAKKNGMATELTLSQIDLATIYVFRGDMFQANQLLVQLGDIESLDAHLQSKLAIAIIEFNVRINYAESLARTPSYCKKMRLLWNRYSKYLATDSWLYYYYKEMVTREASQRLLMKIANSSPKPSIQAAMMYSVLSQSCLDEKKENAYYHYLILSAVNDIKSANREAMSMVRILQAPFINKDSRRAAKYAMLCTDNAKNYNDKWRSIDIVAAHSIITGQYEKKLENRELTMRIIIGLLVLAVVMICLLLYHVLKQRRRDVELITQVRNMNQALQEMVKHEQQMKAQLKDNNQRLENEIQLRNTNFIEVYQLVSQYINDVKEFKKTTFNLITTGKIEKARNALASTADTEVYKHNFYKQFDQAFLTTHPDFIDKLNSLLLPEHQMTLPPSGELSPELRIYALVSIGISDSVSISNFLHYSPQTVYNYRLRMRNKAIISKHDFAETVAQFYSKADV